MGSGTIKNSIHKSIANGIYVEAIGSTDTDYANVFHSMCSQIRNSIEMNEMMLIYFILRYPTSGGGTQGAPYYGYITKPSDQVMMGLMFYPGIADKRVIKFRDSSTDSVATFNIINFA